MQALRLDPFSHEPQQQPLPTPIVPAPTQQGPVVNLVFQVSVPAHQLMHSGLSAGAFQLFAPHLSFQTLNHRREVLQVQPSTPAVNLRFQNPPSPHSLTHPTPTASPTPPPCKLEPAPNTPPLPPPPLPPALGLPTRTPTPPVGTATTTTTTTRPSAPKPPRRPTTTAKTATRNAVAAATRAAAPCPHNRRRSQCIACFELGHGGGSICIHRRRKAGCRLCAAEGRCHKIDLGGPRRRIRGPNTYVPPPPPPPPPPPSRVITVTATATTTMAEGSKAKEVPRAAARTPPIAFSVEALCGLAVSPHP
ncbi:hypothetical protein DFJ73DRAFT_768384 [Zopfochytrium polystomum]|nr:hypothetical protein DFJ73DRAFT_768384 [Zopfochytrium polystomum]